MRNIEIKAHLRDWDTAVETCLSLNTVNKGILRQVDTYFNVPEGRLKLREAEPGGCELIYYHRPEVVEPKSSEYQLQEVPPALKDFLATALGVNAVVDKERHLYLWRNVRIHLDQVQGLGRFIEFEAVLSEFYDEEDSRENIRKLLREFALESTDLLAASYQDMITYPNRTR